MIAISLSLCSCLLNSLAFILMKKSHINTAKAKSGSNAFLQPIWILGFILSFTTIGLDTIAMNYGNQILLASCSAISVLFNSILSVLLLKENIQVGDVFALIVICTGATMFMMNAKNTT